MSKKDTQEQPDNLDRVFKALGHSTRRRILRLLAQKPRYPYELSKILRLTSRVVIKHLEVLQNVDIVSRETGESQLGPERTYYRLNKGFGLSTTILPNSFVVHLMPHVARVQMSHGYVIPKVRSDVRAVRQLLKELTKVNQRVSEIQSESMKLANIRGQIIQRVELIMQEYKWDAESCRAVRSRLNPVRIEGSLDKQKAPKDLMEEVLAIFEKLLGAHVKPVNVEDNDEEVTIDIED
ncbi:MAG: helix-turn-helix domain-containing protein [Candidatus Thorarchaeota archaeon]|nr:helix-turn-helix domain-containing protein [Candidatus Thorarchaeota archaeon]